MLVSAMLPSAHKPCIITWLVRKKWMASRDGAYIEFVELIVVNSTRFSERGRGGFRPQVWRLIMSIVAKVNAKSKNIRAIVISGVQLVFVGSLVLTQQDRYTLKIPDGLA